MSQVKVKRIRGEEENHTMFGTSTPFGTNTNNTFGTPNTNPANTTNTGLFGTAPSQPSTGMFGNASNTATPGTGLFGQPNAASTSLFGKPATSTPGLFGQSSAPSTGLFGQGTPSTTSAGGLFGQPAATSTPGLFGGGTSQPGGLFGQTPATNSGLFGSSTTPAVPPTGGGLFGQSNTTTPGLFNTPSVSGGIFGQQQVQPQPQQGLFGGANTFNSTYGATPTPYGIPSQPAQMNLSDHLTSMAAAWNPASPQCQFKHYFYNMVHYSQVHLYKPATGQDLALYERAQQNNPDSTCMVPVLAIGFQDIKKRIESQEIQTQAHKSKLSEMSSLIQELEQRHHLVTLMKMKEYKRRHTAIIHKVLRLMKHIQLLRNKGYSVRAEEENFRSRLESLEKEISHSSMFRGRLMEMYTQVNSLQDSSFSLPKTESIVLNESSLEPIYESLKTQQTALLHLTDVIKKDQKDVDLMMKGYSDSSFKK